MGVSMFVGERALIQDETRSALLPLQYTALMQYAALTQYTALTQGEGISSLRAGDQGQALGFQHFCLYSTIYCSCVVCRPGISSLIGGERVTGPGSKSALLLMSDASSPCSHANHKS